MRELTTFETREAAGGILPLIIALIGAVVASYTYDPIGGKKEGGDKGTDGGSSNP